MSPYVPSGERFRRLFNRTPDGIWSAPGRVNLIGEFTDYNDGFVLPLAIPFTAQAYAAHREDDLVQGRLRPAFGIWRVLCHRRPLRPAGTWDGRRVGFIRPRCRLGAARGWRQARRCRAVHRQ